jgi:hypothetical protein
MCQNPIGAGVAVSFEGETVRRRKVDRDPSTDDKAFFTGTGVAMPRNGFCVFFVVGF